jgi:hypothetical protein
MCFDFLHHHVSEMFLIPERTEPYMIKCRLVFMYSTRYSCQIVKKLDFYRQIFEKYSYIKFLHVNPSSWGRVVPRGQTDGRTDRHAEANSRFSQFCERA